MFAGLMSGHDAMQHQPPTTTQRRSHAARAKHPPHTHFPIQIDQAAVVLSSPPMQDQAGVASSSGSGDPDPPPAPLEHAAGEDGSFSVAAARLPSRNASSKYDFVKVKVWLKENADHYYVLSRFLLSRMLTVTKLVFSSSTTVYGWPKEVPCTEEFPLSATNPYGRTKLVIEDICHDLQRLDPDWKIILLGYFNPTLHTVVSSYTASLLCWRVSVTAHHMLAHTTFSEAVMPSSPPPTPLHDELHPSFYPLQILYEVGISCTCYGHNIAALYWNVYPSGQLKQVYCSPQIARPSSFPGHECEMLCMQDLSHMAYCNIFIAGFYVRCHEDVRLKCCFDSKIVFLCTCCFDSKSMKISQQYI